MPFPVLQGLFDPLLPKGMQWYWRADFVTNFSSEAVAAHLSQAQLMPPGLSQVHVYPIATSTPCIPIRLVAPTSIS